MTATTPFVRHLLTGNARWLPMVAFFIVVAIGFQVATDGVFLSPRNITLLMRQCAITAVVAMAVSILIIKGEIDLSIGSAVYLCGTAAATLQVHYGMPVVPTILVTLGIGLLLGLWQGLCTVALGVPSFVVTLGGLLGFRGLAYYLTDAATIAPLSPSYSALSEGFVPVPISLVMLAIAFLVIAAFLARSARDPETGRHDLKSIALRIATAAVIFGALAWIFAGYRGIPNAVLWVAACGAVLWFVMTRTVYGRNAYLIGSNREAARLAGIDVSKHILFGFLLMGVFYAIAATLATARLSASTPAMGQYLELDAIAAAVIGGISLRGGIGSIPGAILGAALLVTIDNGMSLLNISSFIQMIIKALLLLLAIAADSALNGKVRHR
jgi:D-xylose transport system permease protein